jgi:hypothetical protein
MRRLARLVLTFWVAASFAATGWTLSQNPFAQPLVARTADEARLALERAVAATVTQDWLVPRLAAAIAGDDPDRVGMLIDLATEHGVALSPETLAAAAELAARHDGALATLADCGTCAFDIRACKTVAQIGACALPVELSPLGDLNALRRAGTEWATDGDADEVEAALAAIGLTATAATLASGGTSLTAKFGATVLRLARRIGALPDGMVRALHAAVTEADGAERLALMAGDIGTLRAQTSTAEVLVLLRYADTPDDLARLARVGEAAGPSTRATLEVLGKARTFRLLDRVTTLAVAAAGLLALVFGQVISILLALLRWVLAPMLRPARRRRPVA